MSSNRSLLGGAKRAVVNWGGDIRRSYSDDHGTFGFVFSYRGEVFIGVSKQRSHRDLASFEQRLVRRAVGEGVLLAEFFGEDPTLGSTHAFQPVTVLEDGQVSIGNSKKGIRTEWLEIPLQKGVLLGDFVSGREEPPEPSTSESESGSTRITDWADA